MRSEVKKLTLDEAFEVYKAGGPRLGRHGMIGMMVEAIKELQARIGNVDEAAVAALDKRVSGLETVIGNALTKATAIVPIEPGPAKMSAAERMAKARAARAARKAQEVSPAPSSEYAMAVADMEAAFARSDADREETANVSA